MDSVFFRQLRLLQKEINARIESICENMHKDANLTDIQENVLVISTLDFIQSASILLDYCNNNIKNVKEIKK